MILLCPVTLPDSFVINHLRNSEFTFHITGSRYLGGETALSDWDFVTQNCVGMRDWLESVGFEARASKEAAERLGPDYGDRYTQCVLSAEDVHGSYQVQLSHDVGAKLYARDAIKRDAALCALHQKMSRDERVDLWNKLCEKAHTIESTWDGAPSPF